MEFVRTHKLIYNDLHPNINKHLIYKEKCYVGVSMLNTFYWEERSIAFWEWIDKRFDECCIIIGDYIDRHNQTLFLGHEAESIKYASDNGDKMLTFLKKFPVLNKQKFTIKRWCELYENKNIKPILNELEEIFHRNEIVRESIMSSCFEFIDRNKTRLHADISSEAALLLCKKYIMEELAVFSLMINMGYRVQIYPGTQLELLKLFADKKTNSSHVLCNGIYIDLRTKKLA